MKIKRLLTAGAAMAFLCGAISAQPAYEHQEKSFEERAHSLIASMTLDEKVSQMVNAADAIPRLGIPEYDWWNECLHGLARSGNATIFPQAIGLAATFDNDLVYRMADAISDEARAFYNSATKRGNRAIYTGLTFYSPNVNIYRDPRWGRGQETYGEDPFLTSRMGVAFVKGLQGNDPKYLKTTACAKHFAVHSGPEKLRHTFDARVGVRDLNETYLPAFKALVKEGHVKSVMGAYNRTNGEACCASRELLQNILVKRWGFNGFLTSDCGAIEDIYQTHKMCSTPEEAVAMAANAGMNLNCGSMYGRYLAKAVRDGLVKESTIDSLLYPLMLTRFQLGMFDDASKVPFNNIDPNIARSKAHKDLAYEAAVKSFVLLENKNGVLPLSKSTNYIYVTGPNANNPDALMGNYFGVSQSMKTFVSGFANKVPNGVTVQYRQGVMIDKPNTNTIDWSSGEAVKADAVIACLGLTWLIEGEEGESIASAQRGDMTDNSIPQCQIDYLKKLKAETIKTGKPLIVVVSGGCPVQLAEVREIADALILAWYPGEAGGDALADIVLGNANPSGRTPMTYVKSVEQLPAFENYAMEGRTYRYMTEEPLYPFGYGLSYSRFEYSDLAMPKSVKAGVDVELSVRVKNVSDRDGDEVVEVYVTDDIASVPVPVRQLSAFKRVSLKAGESKEVKLTVPAEKLSLITNDGKRKIESGMFTVSVGGGQPVKQTLSYVTGKVQVKGNKYIEL